MASSDMTAHQAYRIGRAVYGTQFHFEADTALVVDWNETLSDVIAEFDPEWPAEFPAHLQRSGLLQTRLALLSLARGPI